MNIFFLDSDPRQAAFYHHDIHLRKMILETSQLLSTAHHMKGNPSPEIYKKTHANHPSAIWARSSLPNYFWLLSLLENLHEEYEYRFEKDHASKRILPYLKEAPENISSTSFSSPPLAMPDEYKSNDAVFSYRNYYRKAKMKDKNGKPMATWTKRNKPEWV